MGSMSTFAQARTKAVKPTWTVAPRIAREMADALESKIPWIHQQRSLRRSRRRSQQAIRQRIQQRRQRRIRRKLRQRGQHLNQQRGRANVSPLVDHALLPKIAALQIGAMPETNAAARLILAHHHHRLLPHHHHRRAKTAQLGRWRSVNARWTAIGLAGRPMIVVEVSARMALPRMTHVLIHVADAKSVREPLVRNVGVRGRR